VETDDFVAICFSAPTVELLTARETARHKLLASLGPDAMTDDFDPAEARARLRRHGDAPIGVAIMAQNAMAGIGNEFKSEVLFLRRVNPFATVESLDDDTLDSLIAESHRVLRLNQHTNARRTRFALDERERGWVYGRGGQPCRVCGTVVRVRRQGLEGRTTYYCPQCQGVEMTT
jgi:endonuclease-8